MGLLLSQAPSLPPSLPNGQPSDEEEPQLWPSKGPSVCACHGMAWEGVSPPEALLRAKWTSLPWLQERWHLAGLLCRQPFPEAASLWMVALHSLRGTLPVSRFLVQSVSLWRKVLIHPLTSRLRPPLGSGRVGKGGQFCQRRTEWPRGKLCLLPVAWEVGAGQPEALTATTSQGLPSGSFPSKCVGQSALQPHLPQFPEVL